MTENFCYIALLLVLFCGGCATQAIKQPPCDPISNRSDQFVCGKRDVMQKCRPVQGVNEYVCDQL